MGRITTEYVQSYGGRFDNIAVIPDSGASVKLELWTGIEWIEDSKSPMTTSGVVFARGSRLRFTPTGGGAWIGDGQGGQ